MSEDSFAVDQTIAAVGLCFRKGGKVHYFLPGDFPVETGDFVVVETDKGVDIGEVVEVLSERGARKEKPTRHLLRPATGADVRRKKQLFRKEERALAVCAEKVEAAKLPMKLIEASYTLDGKRLTFSFVSESRVDFRNLVRDLAQTFRCRIELRQVGVRDQAKSLGGLGPCGRPLCCATFLRDFASVGIRLAKDQGLSMNPAKLSGACDRLMCCLRYEHAQYAEMSKRLPKRGAHIETPRVSGEVVERNLLLGTVRLRTEEDNEVEVGFEELEAAEQLRALASSQGSPTSSRFRREERSQESRQEQAPAPTGIGEKAEGEGSQTKQTAGDSSAHRRRRGRRGGRRRSSKRGGTGAPPPESTEQAPHTTEATDESSNGLSAAQS
jgi:cell fate regulator YaaT (PSP1 superfamily)